MTQGVTAVKVDEIIKPLLLKDLRIQCRARGLNPGGGKETLMERLRDHMLSTGNMCIVSEATGVVDFNDQAGEGNKVAGKAEDGSLKNNYVRPEGQNVGNFITDRPSSRVLAPPGGGSNITLG